MTMPAGKYWVGDLCYVMHVLNMRQKTNKA